MKFKFHSIQFTFLLFNVILFVIADEETIPEFTGQSFSDNFGSYSASKMSELLEKIDGNNDKLITKDELIEWIMTLSLKELDKRAKSDINFYDINKDNKITWIEMLRTTYGYNEESVERILESKDPLDKESYQFIIEDRNRFQAADSDNDGFLTNSEYKSLLNPSGNEKLMKLYMDKILTRYDKDNDSEMNEQEFKLYFYLTENLTSTQMIEYENIFRKFDFDKNKKLSIDELEKWYAPDLKVSANFEADSLIAKSDTNNDQILTFNEILLKISDWKESQATSYGDHIRDEL